MIEKSASPDQRGVSLPRWLQPMTVGGVLDTTLRIYRDQFGVLFLTAFLTQIPLILMALLSGPGVGVSFGHVFTAGLVALAGWLAVVWGTATIIGLGSSAFLGKPVVFRSASARAGTLFGSLIWATVVYGLIAFAPFALFGMLAAVLIPLFIKGHQLVAAAFTGSVLVVAGVSYLVYVTMSCILFHQSVVLENLRGMASLKRSRTLIRERSEKGFFKNNVWRLSVILLAILALQLMIYALPALPLILAKFGLLGMPAMPVWGRGAMQVVQGFAQAFALPISILALTVFYYDIRIRKEGLGSELKAAVPNPAPQR